MDSPATMAPVLGLCRLVAAQQPQFMIKVYLNNPHPANIVKCGRTPLPHIYIFAFTLWGVLQVPHCWFCSTVYFF